MENLLLVMLVVATGLLCVVYCHTDGGHYEDSYPKWKTDEGIVRVSVSSSSGMVASLVVTLFPALVIALFF